jgi:TonB family protein
MRRLLWIAFVIFTFTCPMVTVAQTAPSRLSLAPIPANNTDLDAEFLTGIQGALEDEMVVIDSGIGLAALRAFDSVKPFNMDLDQGRNLGEAVGAQILMIFETSLQPRTSFSASTSHEAFISIYLVSSKTGRLLGWRLFSFVEPSEDQAIAALWNSKNEILNWMSSLIAESTANDLHFITNRKEGLLEDFSGTDSKSPAPYRRLSPTYTEQARLYGREGTIELEVDLDENGSVTALNLRRWAGFGLDESVSDAVRAMNWRPAFKGGKAKPSRFLLRYNFAKMEGRL